MPLQVANTSDELKRRIHSLWWTHVVLTRQFILAVESGNMDSASKLAAMLMKNQEDIGSVIGKFFGKAAGDRVTHLLKEHIGAAADYVKAAFKHEKPAMMRAASKLMANVDRMAAALNNLSPFWPKIAWKKVLTGHIMHTKCEVDYRVEKNMVGDQACWEQVKQNMAEIANFMTAGIIQQFKLPRTGEIMQIPKALRTSMMYVHSGRLV